MAEDADAAVDAIGKACLLIVALLGDGGQRLKLHRFCHQLLPLRLLLLLFIRWRHLENTCSRFLLNGPVTDPVT
jgi:hypothetical protein